MKEAAVTYAPGFQVLTGDPHSQAASMVIAPGGKEGGPDNRHRGADQWLYVQSGEGEARVNGEVYRLAPRSLILVQRGDAHEIRNTGTTPLETLSVYVPPAYTGDGEELPAGKS